MATIGKIREKSGIVIILIGLAMLGFIATDLLSSRTGLFAGKNAPKGIGRIYGEEINPATFSDRYTKALNNQRQQSEELSPFMEGQISEQIWNQIVTDRILSKESSELGLDVTGQEIMDLVLGPNPHPIAEQYLRDPQTHQYNRQQISQFISSIGTRDPQAQEFWSEFENYLTQQRMQEKFVGLVKNGLFVTDLEAASAFNAENKTVSFQYVPLFLNAIPDSTVTLTDADFSKYYDAHKEEHKRTESRTMQYVDFDVAPTQQDTMAARNWIAQQAEAFRKTTNDSAFVTRIGRGTYSNTFQPRGSYPAAVEDQIFASDTNSIIGPYYQDGNFYMVKVISKKPDTMYTFHASHILIKPSGPGEADSAEAVNRANEIMKDIKAGTDFAAVAAEKSQDPSNASKGGDLGWFREGQMVKRFNDAVKAHSKGDIFVVRTEFGAHIVKITDNPSKTLVKAAVLERPVMPGKETEENAYNLASKFRSQATNQETFDATSTKMGLTKRLAENLGPNEHQIAGLQNPRELVRWAFNADTKVGDITDPRRIGTKYVVAILTKTTEEGYPTLEEVKEDIRPMVMNDKKKEMLADRLAEAKKNNNSLDGIAKAVQSSVNDAQNVTLARPAVGNLSNEGRMVGYAFGLKKGQISDPIVGENGAFIIKVTETNDIKPPQSLEEQRKNLQAQQTGPAGNAAMEALRDKADVQDYRYLYY